MITSQCDFDSAKSRGLILLKCKTCSGFFKKPKNQVQASVNNNKSGKRKIQMSFCSRKCYSIAQVTSLTKNCTNCQKEIFVPLHDTKRRDNFFCSHSCSATYNNINKTHGYRRSKLEIWLESKFTELYPALEIHFNRKDAINSELDIYIPGLKLAFELNGIFHYEDIYGTLDKIQNNDRRKLQACAERGIAFCVIDTSGQKYFKESTSQKYLEIIVKVLSEKMVAPSEVASEPPS